MGEIKLLGEVKLESRAARNLDTEKLAALNQALRAIQKQYGAFSIMPANWMQSQANHIIPTGIKSLDAALGIGGVPMGRVVEIYGREDSGKSALALQIVNNLPADSPALYIDADHHISPITDARHELYVLDVETLEDAFEACRIAAPVFGAIVIDTLSALPTQYLLDPVSALRTADKNIGKIVSHALEVLVPLLSKTGCTLILVNQLREKPGILYGNPEHPTGGNAIKYYSAIRMDVRQYQINAQGMSIRVNVTKNKCAAPYKTAELYMDFENGGLQEKQTGRGDE